MKPSDKKPSKEITRRDALKYSGLTMGGLAFGGALIGPGARRTYAKKNCPENACDYEIGDGKITQAYDYFENLPEITPWGYKVEPSGELSLTGTPLEADEMRITFLGSVVPPVRRAQQEMSVFVEVGWDHENQYPKDQFVFDCGSGVCANYGAMGIGYGRMNKIFLAHLHGDHMSDLAHIYCFGPSADRKSPLYVWGPGPSGVKSPRPPRRLYKDGTKAFCEHLREAMRWHSESFSFEATSWTDSENNLPTQDDWGLPVKPVPVADDPPNDGYALVPIELDWTKYGEVLGDNVAYDNPDTGVRITHFPVIHTRKGAIGYKLEWTPPSSDKKLTMIYTSDTRPEWHSIDQANNVDPDTGDPRGVDVFIHEMGLPPEVWAMKNLGLDAPNRGNPRFDEYVKDLYKVIDCSHTPPGAFGYLLSQIDRRPRLTVATHFPVADDTVECALNSVTSHCPWVVWDPLYPNSSNMIWSFDLMVIRVFRNGILQQKAEVNDFGFSPVTKVYGTNDPKYTNTRKQQLDTSEEIKAGDDTYCENGY